MTSIEVRNIALEVVKENNDINRALLELVPTLSTKQACKLLKCGRKWLYRNKHLFGGQRVSKRGDLKFETIKIMRYHEKTLQEN